GVLGIMTTSAVSYSMSAEPVYHIAYYILTIVAFSLVARRPNLASYELAVMAFLAIGFNYLTYDIHWSLKAYQEEEKMLSEAVDISISPKHFGDAALSGTCLLIVVWVAMIIAFSRSASK
ncbi:MAG: hypothetical protein RLZZ86_3915, partial [Cyanobacteriota bacterium]